MNPTFEHDDSSLAGLSTLQPDRERSARTRQQCRAALQRRVRAVDAVVREPLQECRNVENAGTGELLFRNALAGAVGLLCLVYVAELIATTVRLQAMLH